MDIPVYISREPAVSLPCAYPESTVAWLVGDQIKHATVDTPGERVFLGSWGEIQVTGSITKMDARSRSYDAIDECQEGMQRGLSDKHRANLQKVAREFEQIFGHSAKSLFLQYAGWVMVPGVEPFSWELTAHVMVLAYGHDMADVHRTTWDDIPATW